MIDDFSYIVDYHSDQREEEGGRSRSEYMHSRYIRPAKRQANSRRLSVSGKSPRSPTEVSSSDEEHNLGKNTLAEGSEHASVSEMDIPLSAVCKSPENTHSPNVSEKNSPQGSHGIVNLVNGLLCASPGHSAPVDNQEILSDMVVTDGELNGPVSGRKIELKGNMNFSTPDIVLDLSVSGNGRTILSPNRLVSVGTKRDLTGKALPHKKLANRRRSRELCTPNSSTWTVQQRGTKEVAEPMEECPLALECLKSGTKEQLDCLAEQAHRKVDERSVLQNAGSSQYIIDSSPLRSCSAYESFLLSPEPLGEAEAMHVKQLPQQPHFHALQKFADLVNITKQTSIDNSMEWFKDKMKTISHVQESVSHVQEIVQLMQRTMSELVELKSERTSCHGEIDKLDLKIVETTDLSSRLAAEIAKNDISAAKLEKKLGHIRQQNQKKELEKEKIDGDVASFKTARSGWEDVCSSGERKFYNAISALQQQLLP